MKLSNYLIILITIILGFCIDTFINQFTVQLFIELNFGFLIFSYWIFAMPERLHSFIPLIYGLVIDLFFSTAVGFNMLFFVATSYVIHTFFVLGFFLTFNFPFSSQAPQFSILHANTFCFLP